MKTIHTSHLLPRLLAGAFVLASSVLAPPVARAQNVVPTRPLYNPDGTLAGLATSEASVYFLVPSRWLPLAGAHTPPVRLSSVTSPTGETFYDLCLVLSPDYARATPTVVAIRGQDAQAVFFPLPMTIEHVTLFLPEAIGSIQAELVPDEQELSTPVALYYRLRFTAEQLGVLRVLAHGGLTLQGTIEYAYAAPDGVGETATPLTIILDNADLEVSTKPASDPTAWLADLLSTTRMSVSGALDGPYSLGGGIAIQISHSRVDGWLMARSLALHTGGDNMIQLQPTSSEDLAGTITFDVAQLGAIIRVDYQAVFGASLDLSLMRLSISQLDITKVIVNGSPSAFYTVLLKRLMTDPAVRALVSRVLSDELQRRILSETLFTLGDVLP